MCMWHMSIMLEYDKVRQKECEFKDSLDLKKRYSFVCLCIYVHMYIEHTCQLYIYIYPTIPEPGMIVKFIVFIYCACTAVCV